MLSTFIYRILIISQLLINPIIQPTMVSINEDFRILDYFCIEKKTESVQNIKELELLACLAQAEAGNQNLAGKRLVVDVVINRVKSDQYPDSIEEVIFDPGQFSCIEDGNFVRASQNISEEAWLAAEMEYEESILDSGILYFGREPVNGKMHWKYGDHWFSY